MKANAPEKIYIDDFGSELSHDWHTEHSYENDIEYIRKDAFIEKALKWYCLDCECNDNCNADYKCFFKQEYKRYLEGNNNAIPPKFDNAINPDGSVTENYRYRHFIRKVQDAFIEKAFEFFGEHLWEYIDVKNVNCDTFINIDGDKLKEDFKNYMEESKV